MTIRLDILTCRACGFTFSSESKIAWGNTYWQGIGVAFCSKESARATLKDEAIECQTIDADCNDCIHFKRGEMLAKGAASAFSGHCMKFDKPTIAYPNFATGHKCFEHRKAAGGQETGKACKGQGLT